MASSKSKTREVDFPLPTSGINLVTAWHELPAGYSPDLNNALAFDSLLGRKRMGQRPGLSKFFGSAQFGGGAKWCQHLSQVTLATVAGGVVNDYILTVFAGTAYLQKPGDTSITALTGHTFSAGRRVEAAAYQDVIYFTDGLSMQKCTDLATLVPWTASAGSLPVSGGEYPRYLVEWRGRMVLGHLDKAGSGQIFFTAQGDPTNFDYGADNTPTIAVASTTNFRAGQMADALTGLVPMNEDILLISTSHGLLRMVGDPADGGALMPLSQEVGMLNNDAWCIVEGTLYFVGTGGFYMLDASGSPQNLSRDTYNANFQSLFQVALYAECIYDHSRHLIWIFLTHEASPFTTTHVAYDLRTGGFFPISFPSTTGGDDELGGTTAPKIGPTKACTFDGTSGTNNARAVLIGCRDGYVRQIDDTALTDDVADMPGAYFVSGLVQPAGATQEAFLNGAYLTCGENASFNVQIDLFVGDDPYSALQSSPAETVTLTSGGRQSPLGWRDSANSFFVKMSNSVSAKRFDAERLTAIFGPSGPVR